MLVEYKFKEENNVSVCKANKIYEDNNHIYLSGVNFVDVLSKNELDYILIKGE